MALARQQQDHAESTQGRHHIGDGVEHRRTVGVGCRQGIAIDHARSKAQQHETHLRDGRISQHALQVGLRNRRQITDQQRDDRHHDQHLLPVDRQTDHAFDQQTHRDGKGRKFRRRRDQQCHRSGRALVNVRHPHMERCSTKLEGQTGDDKDDTKNQYRLVRQTGADDFENLRNRQRSGGAIHHRQAVKQKSAGECTKHEILHRRFGRDRVITAQGHQRIERQTHQLEAKVDDQKVIGRQHDEDTEQRK